MINPDSCSDCEYFLQHGDTHICSYVYRVGEGCVVPENPTISKYKVVHGICPKLTEFIERGI